MSRHSALTDAHLHRPGYYQADDPGAIGSGKAWVDTTTTPYELKIRNAADDGWVGLSGDITGVTAGAGLTGGGTSGAVTLDVIGTADRITVAADSIDIASTYVGQTSITTLGTIATGAWNATAIAIAKVASGTARQLVQTNAGGTAAEWTSNVDIPGTLDVTGAAVFDLTVSIPSLTVTTSASITGLTAIGNVYLTRTGAAPRYMINEGSAAADNRLWDITASSEALKFRTIDDAQTGTATWLTVNRTGTTIDSISFGSNPVSMGALTTTGLLQVTLTSEQARLRYSATEYQSITVGATGTTAFAKVTAGTKLYTFDAKISTTGEIEVDGDFNHDGTNFGALGAAPAPQRAHQADATDLATAISAVNYALATLETFGYHAAA